MEILQFFDKLLSKTYTFVQNFVQYHPFVTTFIIALGLFFLYAWYIAWSRNLLVLTHKRPIGVPYTFSMLKEHYDNDWRNCVNVCIVMYELIEPFKILFIGVLLAPVLLIGGCLIFLFSIFLFNPMFWLTLAAIKILVS